MLVTKNFISFKPLQITASKSALMMRLNRKTLVFAIADLLYYQEELIKDYDDVKLSKELPDGNIEFNITFEEEDYDLVLFAITGHFDVKELETGRGWEYASEEMINANINS